jgi:hypothetical protein
MPQVAPVTTTALPLGMKSLLRGRMGGTVAGLCCIAT